jgi:hypothetical protein
MGLELTTPEQTNIQVTQQVPFTHIRMIGLNFKFPVAVIEQTTSAEITWWKGTVDGSNNFQPSGQVVTPVPAGPVENWLTSTNTESKKNFVKLEEAMYAYLQNQNLIGPGTIVVLPD